MTQSDQMFTDGAAYERLMGRWSRLAGDRFLHWLDLPAGLRWLDAGCGNGAFTEVIVEKAQPGSVIGIDPAEAQIAFARARPRAQQALFKQGDVQALPFADGEFDVSVMALVISFLSDPEKAVSELMRVVRPGGTVATYMWDLPAGGVPVAPIYKALALLGHPAPMPRNPAISTANALRDLWQSSGLDAVQTTVIRIPVVFDDFEDFWASNAMPVGPQAKFLHSLPADIREKLIETLRQQLPVQADGRIIYDAVANAVTGRKPQ